MTDTRVWTFRKLRADEPRSIGAPPVGVVATASGSNLWLWVIGGFATFLLVGGGIAAYVVFMFIFPPSSTLTGSYIYSAMALNANVTRDDDLAQILHFVVSDMGGKYGYRELLQRSGVRRLDTLLAYQPTRARPEDLRYNTQLSQSLPWRFDRFKGGEWWFESSTPEQVSSCICGYNDDQMMQILYNEDSPTSRVAVVAHEYYHVIQMNYCGDMYSGSRDELGFVMWLSEGCATVFQNMYVDHWLTGHQYYSDNPMFNIQYGHVRQMIDSVQAGTFTYDSTMNSYDGAQNNYIASTTAVLYLIHRMGGGDAWQYMLVRYLETGDCDFTTKGGRDAGFQNAFSIWPTINAFYADLNAYLSNTTVEDAVATLQPTASDVTTLLSHTTFCSDVCTTSRNGVCDASCEYGSDCTDCGNVSKPDSWNIVLREPYNRPGAARFSPYTWVPSMCRFG